MGPIHNKSELAADIQKHLQAFPGVIFNYTQPAEDAVDEALTGLKSALAVKIYGPDLNVLPERCAGHQAPARTGSRIHGVDRGPRTGPAQLLIDVDRDKIARYGINVSDVEAIVQQPSAARRQPR